jgi:thiamine-phosphate pyrophosphorylase
MMASSLQRRRLAREALRHTAQSGFLGRLPPLVLFTDSDRLADPCPAARLLPKGSAVILRHRQPKARAALAAKLITIARTHALVLLIANDPALAAKISADGVHFPDEAHSLVAYWRIRRPDWLITMAAHSEAAIRRANAVRADAVFLSPVFATQSHPERLALGPLRAGFIARRARLPVYALGGIDERSVMRLRDVGVAGLGAIGALAP